MIGLGPVLGQGRAISHLVGVAAHPDDLEIGCGGTLRQLAAAFPGLRVDVVLATGDAYRLEEAHKAAALFLPGCTLTMHCAGLPDGRLPAHWNAVKEHLETVAATQGGPDVVLAPRRTDRHQDHRVVAELVPTVWRDHLVLGYEIPKWDGDLDRPWLYVPLTDDEMDAKVQLLFDAYPSQVLRDWFDQEVFRGLARLRGMECRASYAEAFTTDKAVLTWL